MVQWFGYQVKPYVSVLVAEWVSFFTEYMNYLANCFKQLCGAKRVPKNNIGGCGLEFKLERVRILLGSVRGARLSLWV